MTPPARITVGFTLNAAAFTVAVEPRETLAAVLYGEARLAGVHVGCDDGSCGSCTVIVDGQPVRACTMLAVQADQRDVRTVESLAGDELHPLQRAFAENFAVGCGFCTPGFLMLAVAAFERNPSMGDEDLVELASANMCRCTGYQGILRALKAGRQQIAGQQAQPRGASRVAE